LLWRAVLSFACGIVLWVGVKIVVQLRYTHGMEF
jgi:hypothetical protein